MAKKRRSGRPQPTNGRVTPAKPADPWARPPGVDVVPVGCGHPPIKDQMRQLRAAGIDEWCCAIEVLDHGTVCRSAPAWAVAWPMDVDGEPHIMIGPFCDEHHRPAVERIADIAVILDGASSSMAAPWQRLADLLGEIHDPSGRGVCSAAAVTFAIVRPD